MRLNEGYQLRESMSKKHSLPTQEEPEGSVMLGREHPHGSSRRVEFGSDGPVCGG
jgi:hypothetical protein